MVGPKTGQIFRAALDGLDQSHTFIEVPNGLVPAVRELLAKKVA
jgi:hypothetical protein